MSLQLTSSDEPIDFLRQKSGVYKARAQGLQVTEVLIIDDSALDAKAMGALVRSAFGHDTAVRHANSLMRGQNMILERLPDLLILDDILPPKGRAEASIATLRHAQFNGPIFVVSGEMTRLRRLSLLQAGACAVVHKDDINSAALVRAVAPVESEADQNDADSSRPVDAHDDDLI